MLAASQKIAGAAQGEVFFCNFEAVGGGAEGFETLARNGMLLRHIHLARTLGRALPCPGDEEDYTGFFAALYRGGYCGTVSIEGHPSGDFAKQAQTALAHLRACDEKARLLVGIEETR